MDPLRALKLIARGKSFDESAVQSGIARKGAYQMDAYPEYDAAMSQVRDGGPAADAMFDDMIRFYAGDSSPVPVPASRKADPVTTVAVMEDLSRRMSNAKDLRNNLDPIRKESQEFKDDYMYQIMNDTDFNSSTVNSDDNDMDNLLLAAGLGSILTGGALNRGNKEEEES